MVAFTIYRIRADRVGPWTPSARRDKTRVAQLAQVGDYKGVNMRFHLGVSRISKARLGLPPEEDLELTTR